jgi:hypothetical protein
MNSGDYVTYESNIYGKGYGQVIDVITKDNKEVVLCEPLYSKRSREREQQLEPVIVLDITECKESSDVNIGKRMRFR